MQNAQKKSFIQGALILVVANLIVKLIGALYNIPLTNLIGEDGIGYYTTAYELYAFLFVLSTAGLPVAVSKMVSASNALGRAKEVQKIFKVSLMTFIVVGAAGSFAMYMGAKAFSHSVNNDLAYLSVVVVAPSIFFVAVISTYRGFFQGLQDMVPTAISQVIEALCKLFVGFFCAWYFIKKEAPIHVTASGAILGVTVGTILSALYLIFASIRSKQVKEIKIEAKRNNDVSSTGKIFKTLIKYAIPITIGASVMSLTNILDLFVVMNRLGDIGFTQKEANSLFGSYTMARKLFNLPASIIFSLGISVIPVLSGAYATKDKKMVRRTIRSAIRICTLFAIPAGFGLAVLSKPILDLLYFTKPQAVNIAAPLLTELGPAVAFVCLVSLTNSILQAIGMVNAPVVTMVVGGAVKLLTNYILIGIPSIGIQGAPIGTSLCYGTITVLNFWFISKATHSLPRFKNSFLKPILSSIALSIAAVSVYNILFGIVGSKIAVLIAICIGGLIYFAMMLALKGILRSDILLLPKGQKIAAFMEKHNWIN